MTPLFVLVPSLLLLAAQGDAGNLLENPSFEEGGKSPKGWKKGSPVPGVEYLVDAKVAAEGKRSLSLQKTVDRYFPIAEWEQEVAHDGQAARAGNGIMIAFLAPSTGAVDAAHAAGLAAGGQDEGKPGPRPEDSTSFYGGYLRDLTGNKLCVFAKP